MKAVLFDLFGTLVDNPTITQIDELHRVVSEALGVPKHEFRDGWRETYVERARGAHASMAESIEAAAKYCSVPFNSHGVPAAVQLRYDITKSWLVPRSDAVNTISSLRARNLKIGLLTNCSAEVPSIWPNLSVAPLFDTLLFSSVELLRKPMPDFFERALERMEVSPAECLFVADGDNGELAAAQALGIPAVMIRPSERLEDYRQNPEEDWNGIKIERLSELLKLEYLTT